MLCNWNCFKWNWQFVLFNCKNLENDLTQRYILINLCFIDFSLSIFLGLYQATFSFKEYDFHHYAILSLCISIVKTGNYFTTLWLIVDRYLHIKLNKRYVIYWSKMKTIIAVMFLWILMGVIGYLF